MSYNLNFVRILSDNFKDSLKFYKNTLGLEVKSESDNYAEFNTGNSVLAIYTSEDMAKALKMEKKDKFHECSDTATIIFQVDNVDAEYEKLKEKAVAFLCVPTDRPDWKVRTAHFRDPDGNLIEINQRI